MWDRRSLLVLAALTGCAAVPAPATPSNAAVWEHLARFDSESAQNELAHLPAREASLAEATILLNRQPKSDRDLDQAEALLRSLVRPETPDDLALSAQWLLARIAHAHRRPVRTTEARVRYEQLISFAREHPLAEQAVVKLALLDLYGPDPRETLPARWREWDRRAAELRHPAARRDLHLLLARTAQFFSLSDEHVLRHLEGALATGALGYLQRGNALAATVDLARRLQRPALARRAAEEFLRDFPRDDRIATIKEWLQALPAS